MAVGTCENDPLPKAPGKGWERPCPCRASLNLVPLSQEHRPPALDVLWRSRRWFHLLSGVQSLPPKALPWKDQAAPPSMPTLPSWLLPQPLFSFACSPLTTGGEPEAVTHTQHRGLGRVLGPL